MTISKMYGTAVNEIHDFSVFIIHAFHEESRGGFANAAASDIFHHETVPFKQCAWLLI